MKINEIRDVLYINDIITGGETVEITARKKTMAKEVFAEATFILHKWHSNTRKQESLDNSSREELTFAKEQLGGASPLEVKLLVLPWNKEDDKSRVGRQAERNNKKRCIVLPGQSI